jgi:NAD-dependent DNA ligase
VHQRKLPLALSALKNFILPGGSKGAACLHLARTVCRRAERKIVRLQREEDIGENVVIFVNRMSDLLFVIPSEVLKDKTVCFTGEDKASREYWKAVVEAVGGINVSGVTRNTSFLVMADKTSTSTKAKSAARYGTICLSYNEFQKMIESS